MKEKNGLSFHSESSSDELQRRKGRSSSDKLDGSKGKYQSIFEIAPIGIGVSDIHGNFLEANQKMQDMTGYTFEDLMHEGVGAIYANSDEYELLLGKLKETGKVKDCEIEFRRKDNTKFPVLLNMEFLELGKTRLILTTARDFTRYKKAEDLLRESEERYRNLVELTTDIIYISDNKGNQIFMNDASYRLLETNPEEVIGQQWSKWIHPDDRAISLKKFREMIEKGIDIFSFENRYVSTTGRVINALHNIRVLRNEKGEILGTQGIAHDITDRKWSEEMKRQSEKKYRMLIENMHDGVFIIQDAKLQFVNEAFARIAGYSVGEIIGRDFSEFVAPEDVELVADRYHRRQAGEKIPSEYEFKMMRKDGKRIVVNMNVGLITYRGKVASMGILKDITERKRAEEALREGERFLANIFESIQDGIGVIDTDMNILQINPTAQRWYPHNKPFIGKKCYEAFHNRSEPCHPCPASRTLNTGESAYEIVPKHGPGGENAGWLEIYSYPMRDTATGQMKGVIEYVRDITERNKVEESLALFSQAVENAPDGVQIVGMDGRIIYSNKAVEEIYGFSPSEFMGKHVDELNLDPEFASEVILPGIKKNGQWVGELLVKHKFGKLVHISLNTSMIKNSKGEPIALMGIIRDITIRKEIEEEIKKYARDIEESNRLKDLFTDIMAHDLLNPLNIARGYVELFKENETNPGKLEYLETIKRNLARSLELIENTTMLSKLESLKRIEFDYMDMKEVIGKVVENLKPMVTEAGMTIENSISQSVPIRGNRIIEEVFTNLISNAVKYASDGKKIIIKCVDDVDFWNIMFIDLGEGIKDAEKIAIFERFHRMEKKGVKGSGLGLAIARKIMELHNGRIWVEDNPKGGAIFVVAMPKSY